MREEKTSEGVRTVLGVTESQEGVRELGSAGGEEVEYGRRERGRGGRGQLDAEWKEQGGSAAMREGEKATYGSLLGQESCRHSELLP